MISKVVPNIWARTNSAMMKTAEARRYIDRGVGREVEGEVEVERADGDQLKVLLARGDVADGDGDGDG